jgi:hypothetical protein
MEPYLLIIHLAANLWNPNIPPTTVERPSRADCLKSAQLLKELGNRTQCIRASSQVLTIAQ